MSIGNHGTLEISYAKSARVGPLEFVCACVQRFGPRLRSAGAGLTIDDQLASKSRFPSISGASASS